MKPVYHPAASELSLPNILHALSDPIRLAVVKALAENGELTCGSFAVPVAKSTLSHHLRVLRESGVTQAREEGTAIYTSLRRADLNARFPGVLDAILQSCDADALYAHAASSEPICQ